MLKKIILIAACIVVTLSCGAQEAEFKLINALNYHKSMFSATPSADYLKIPFGKEMNAVGGQDEDVEAVTSGVPWAFRMVDGGKVWVLDSINKLLKLFTPEGKVERSISLKEMGKVVIDFAIAPDGSFAFLNATNGYVYITDEQGKMVRAIEGFNSARAIEFSPKGDLLVNNPIMGANLRLSIEGELKEQFVCDESLSLFSADNGQLLGLEVADSNAKLYLRTVASPTESLVLAEFPYTEKFAGVTYAGGELLGRDASGSLYFSLVACDEEGHIFRDRLYRCSIEGKVLGELDVLTIPHLAPDLPRKRIACPDGRVMSYYPASDSYRLCTYVIP